VLDFLQMKRRFAFTLLGLVFLVGAYLGWVKLTSPWGDQVVHYQPSSESCFSGGTAVKWKYCLHTAPQGTNGAVAYFLHGRGHDEKMWNDDTFYTAMIQKFWADHGTKPPLIVSLSFGRDWILAPKGKAEKSGLLDVFMNELIPDAERRIGSPPRYRVVFGESMGGLNSLIAGMNRPDFFQKVLSLCSPIYKVSAFSGFGTFRDFLTRSGADPRVIFGIRLLGLQYAADEQEWNKISPYELLKKSNPRKLPELYVSDGLYDKYGIYEGGEAFAEMAKAKGIPLIWRPLYGGHCAIDITSAAEFLGSPPERHL
jgi:S-formylglutathione hydrolase FrmB